MGIAPPAIDVTAAERRTVLALLDRYLPNTTVWAYGSRVKWTSRPESDLDLVVFTRPDQSARVAELREAFDESDLPFSVDLFVWDEISDSFRKRIETEHAVLAEERPCAIEDWPTATLGDCIEINNSTYAPKDSWPFINYLDTGSVTENRIAGIQHLVVGKDEIPSRARRKVLPGDIVYSTVRPNQKHFGLLKSIPDNFLASTGFFVIRGKRGLAHTDFIYWFLAQDRVVEQLQTIAEHSASAYPSIKSIDIERLTLNLPPFPEQRAIAGVLGALDDRIELNRRMNATLEAMARALFQSWFVDFDPVRAKMAGRDTGLPKDIADLFPDRLVDSELGDVPAGWAVRNLENCFEITMGQSPPGHTYNDTGDGLPFFQGCSNFGFRYPSDRKFCTAPNRIAEPEDTLVSVRAPVGDVNMAWSRCCIGRGVAALRHRVRAASFTYYTMQTLQARLREYEDTGTVFGAITRTQLGGLPIPQPPTEVVHAFESLARMGDEAVRRNTARIDTLTTLRSVLSPRLVSGRVRMKGAKKSLTRTS